jgi:hypothetical protein
VPARWLPLAWALLWIGVALFQALPGQNSGTAVAAEISGGSASAPAWLGQLDASIVGWTARHGTGVVLALLVSEALIGLAALHRRTRGPAVVAGCVLALAIWKCARPACAMLMMLRRRSTGSAERSTKPLSTGGAPTPSKRGAS